MGRLNVYGVPGLPGIHHETQTLDGNAAAAALKTHVAADVRRRVAKSGSPPVLATILVGNDPASETYVAAKHRACAEVGIESVHHDFDADESHEQVAACIASLNVDPEISGVLLQLPLPSQLDARRLLDLVDPGKDVDGLTAVNMGRLLQGQEGLVPCTPRGVLALLDHYRIELEGRNAVVVGRSQLVGRPIAALLTKRNATVTLCHSRTRDLAWECRRANVLVVAAGRPRLIGYQHVRQGAVVVDVGIHRTRDGLVGDVDSQALRGRAQAISPVPGGVGPMTIAALLENTLTAAGGGAEQRQSAIAREGSAYDPV